MKRICKYCEIGFKTDDKRRRYCTWNCYNKFRTGNSEIGFDKGHVPWNKNMKGIHLSPKSEFKKGCEGIRKVAVGTKSVRIGKGKVKRMWIKIGNPRMWVEYARFIWMKNNGKIKDGFVVHHIDENPLNDKIENLALLSRKFHFELHKIGEYRLCNINKKKKEKGGNYETNP